MLEDVIDPNPGQEIPLPDGLVEGLGDVMLVTGRRKQDSAPPGRAAEPAGTEDGAQLT